MTTPVRVVLNGAAFTAPLRAKSELAGRPVEFPTVRPIHRAFREMIRNGAYDVSEMAIGAFLQARDVGQDLFLLPIAMSGDFHHRSLYSMGAVASPGDLAGKRVGVRSYSQTSGLWVRGWLDEEEGVRASDVTWVVTEGSHVEDYRDPANVEAADAPVRELLARGDVDAAILGLSDDVDGLVPLLSNPVERSLEWYERHGCVPLNHLLVTTRRMMDENGEMLQEIYRSLTDGIESGLADPPRDAELPSAVTYGRDEVLPALRIAAHYARDQALVRTVSDLDALFVPDLGR